MHQLEDSPARPVGPIATVVGRHGETLDRVAVADPEMEGWRRNEMRFLAGRVEELERQLRRRTWLLGGGFGLSLLAAAALSSAIWLPQPLNPWPIARQAATAAPPPPAAAPADTAAAPAKPVEAPAPAMAETAPPTTAPPADNTPATAAAVAPDPASAAVTQPQHPPITAPAPPTAEVDQPSGPTAEPPRQSAAATGEPAAAPAPALGPPSWLPPIAVDPGNAQGTTAGTATESEQPAAPISRLAAPEPAL